MNLKNLQFLFKPSYWFMHNSYNKDLDRIINELLDKYDFSDLDTSGHTAKLGKATVWVSNIPYGCAHLYGMGFFSNCRPSRLTIKRFVDRFKQYRDIDTKERYKKMINEINNQIL